MKTLIQYPGGRTGGVVIPQGVETLNLDSISCPGMTSILLPASLKLIASAAFYGCDHLTDVYYAGTKAQWALVDKKGSMNEALNQAKIHYNYKNALPPVTAKADYWASTGKPYLKWTAVDGANRYYVYRSTTKDGTYSFLDSTANLNYTDSAANAGTTYYYKIKAGIVNGAKSASSAAVAVTCRCARPVVKPSYVGVSGKPYIYWSAVDGANRYYVYRSTIKDGTYSFLGSTAKLNYTDSKADAGTTYYYKVKAGIVNGVKSNSSAAVTITCRCAKPVVKIATTSAGNPRLTWNAVTGASQYEIYRATSQSGTYTKMFTTTKTSYTNTSAKAGTTYYYKVKAISKVKSVANSAFSTVVSIKAR